MLVAKQKRKENIVEYILYLYQVEDMIRAFKLDMEQIELRLISSYKADDKTKAEISNWYANLILMMDREQKKETGHLQFLSNLIADVNQLHLKLMETEIEAAYSRTFKSIAGLIQELSRKNPGANGDVEIGITAIYGFLLLKMQKKEISADTTEAIKRISNWLAELSKLYNDFESGDLSFE